MQKITPFLWFNTEAEEAMKFYVSVFKNSKVLSVSRYGDAGPMPKGTVMVANFEILGQQFMALNGGPHFKISPAISFLIDCEDQAEVDYYWSKLTEGGQEIECGWLTDKFGVSWQVVPKIFGELMSRGEPEKINRMMKALMTMKKLDSEKLKNAYEGK